MLYTGGPAVEALNASGWLRGMEVPALTNGPGIRKKQYQRPDLDTWKL